MCHLQNIAMRDYQESVTTGQTHTHRQTPDKVIFMCHYASQATQKLSDLPIFSLKIYDLTVGFSIFHCLNVQNMEWKLKEISKDKRKARPKSTHLLTRYFKETHFTLKVKCHVHYKNKKSNQANSVQYHCSNSVA